MAVPLEGALSPNNCRRSEAEKGFPCSKLKGIHKLKEARKVTRINGEFSSYLSAS